MSLVVEATYRQRMDRHQLPWTPDEARIWRNLRQRKDTLRGRRDPRVVTSTRVLTMLVSDVLAGSPAAAGVFVGHRMGCVGCTFARFETVGEVAEVYGLDPQHLARSLADVLGSVRRT